MMKILFDTNILIDVLQNREPFFEDSMKVMELAYRRKIEAFIAAHSITNIWYITRKSFSDYERRKLIKALFEFFTVSGLDFDKIQNALDREDFPDFEDCLQDECACFSGADYIITRNPVDFNGSKVIAVTPKDFILKFNDL